jgi:hypothetical protein
MLNIKRSTLSHMMLVMTSLCMHQGSTNASGKDVGQHDTTGAAVGVQPKPDMSSACFDQPASALTFGLVLPTGQLFPDTDPKWKGARSDIFLNEAVSAFPDLVFLPCLPSTRAHMQPKPKASS